MAEHSTCKKIIQEKEQIIQEKEQIIREQQHSIESHQKKIEKFLAEKMYSDKKTANLAQDSKKNIKHLATLEAAYNDLNE